MSTRQKRAIAASEPRHDSWVESRLQTTHLLMLETVAGTGSTRLDDLMAYHFSQRGACMRARLALSSAHALGLPDRTCIALAACCELIHNGSLLHDDIQDNAHERRGQVTAWREFDVNTAMCAGTFLLSAAYQILARLPSHCAELVGQVHRSSANLIGGQVRDLQATRDPLDLEMWVAVARGKSGSLLALPLELSLIAAGQFSSISMASAAGQSFAVAYQIIDDIADAETDLSRGQNNIVAVLLGQKLDYNESIERARDLAQSSLSQACTHARWLPGGSGLGLVDLCQQLSDAASLPLSAEVQAA